MGRKRMAVGFGVVVALGAWAGFGAGRAADAGGRAKADPVVELGRRLFFDPAVSRSGDNSCASCHEPAYGFSSPSRLDVDDFSMTKRHSQSLVDAALGKRFHWDGEFDSVADLVTARLGAPAGARARHGAAARGEALASTSVARGGTTVSPPAPVVPAAPPPPAAEEAAPVEEPPPPAEDDADDAEEEAPRELVPYRTPYTNPCAPYHDPGGGVVAGLREPSDPEPKDGEAKAAAPKEEASKEAASKETTSKEETSSSEASKDAATTPETPSTAPAEAATPTPTPSPSPYGAPASTSDATGTDAGSSAATETAPESAPTHDAVPDASATESSATSAAAPEAASAESGADAPAASSPTPTATPAPATTGGSSWAPATAAPDTSASSSESGGTGGSGKDQPTSSTSDERRAAQVAERVEKDGRYAEAFEAAFGSRQVTTARIAEAVAAYVASIRSGESAYDRFAAGDATALDASAQRGLALFRGRAGCAQCHVLAGARASFTDDGYHNTGVSARSSARMITTPVRGPSAAAYDLGRAAMTRSPRDVGAFKTPSLREVATRGPYMHDGSFRTLEAVVRHYARGGFADANLDPRLRKFPAADADVADLVAFLRALTSDETPGLAPDFGRRAATTSLRFVDRTGHPIVGMPVALEPAGDRLPGDLPLTSRSYRLVTDADGRIAYAPVRRSHMRLTLPVGVEVAQGSWVPDTCRDATLVTDTAGRASLLLALPAAAPASRALLAIREARALTDEQRATLARHAPTTLAALRSSAATFTLEGVVEVAGRTYARYDAWVDGEGSPDAIVEVPLPARRATVHVSLAPGRETRVDLPR